MGCPSAVGRFVMAKDPEQEVSGRAIWHGLLPWFEWIVEVPGPVAFVSNLL